MNLAGCSDAESTGLKHLPLFKERGITEAKLNGLLQDRTHFIGNAQRQVSLVNAKAQPLLIKYHKEAQYEPKPIV